MRVVCVFEFICGCFSEKIRGLEVGCVAQGETPFFTSELTPDIIFVTAMVTAPILEVRVIVAFRLQQAERDERGTPIIAVACTEIAEVEVIFGEIMCAVRKSAEVVQGVALGISELGKSYCEDVGGVIARELQVAKVGVIFAVLICV